MVESGISPQIASEVLKTRQKLKVPGVTPAVAAQYGGTPIPPYVRSLHRSDPILWLQADQPGI